MPDRVSVAAPVFVKPPVPAIMPWYVPAAVWLMVSSWPPLLIVAVLVPLLGFAIAPLSDPFVVPAVVERLSTTLVPAPVLGLLTTSAPMVPPSAAALPADSVPPFTLVLPSYVLAPLSVRVPAPLLVR